MMMNLIKDCITFFQAGGVFMYPLAACSVLLIAAVIYRMFNMKKSLICPVVLTRAVEQYTRGAVGRTELESGFGFRGGPPGAGCVECTAGG